MWQLWCHRSPVTICQGALKRVRVAAAFTWIAGVATLRKTSSTSVCCSISVIFIYYENLTSWITESLSEWLICKVDNDKASYKQKASDEEHKVRGFALTDLRHVSVEFTVHVPMLKHSKSYLSLCFLYFPLYKMVSGTSRNAYTAAQRHT